jgi:hypothetical protein
VQAGKTGYVRIAKAGGFIRGFASRTAGGHGLRRFPYHPGATMRTNYLSRPRSWKGERMEVDRPKARLNSPRKAIAKLPKGRGAFPRLPCKCGGMARYTHTTRGGWAFRLWYVCRGCTGQIVKPAFGATPRECRPRIVLSCETLSRELIDMVQKNAQTIRNRKDNPWTSYSSPDAREAGQP